MIGSVITIYFCVIKPASNSEAFSSSNTSSYKQVGELLKDPTTATGDQPFSGNVMTLVNMIYGSFGDMNTQITSLTSTAASTPITAKALRAKTYNKTNEQSIVVRLGGLDWIVTYVSTDTSGNLIATLWLSNNHQSAWSGKNGSIGKYYGYVSGGLYSDWSADWCAGTPSSSYPSNMYGTSYIRTETLNNPNNRNYTAKDGATSLTAAASQIKTLDAHPFTLFTVSDFGLTNYITTPDQMPWMKTFQSIKSMFNWSYDCSNNSLYNTPGTGTWNSSGSYNYAGKTGYTNWGGDYLWLPSLTETGYNDDISSQSTGLWETNTAERTTYNGSTTSFPSSTLGNSQVNDADKAYVYSWTRTASSNFASTSFSLYPFGSRNNNSYVLLSQAVRPALLFNLGSAASHSTTPSNITFDEQGGSGGTTSVSVAEEAALPGITVPTKTGYAFLGYYTSTNGSGTKIYNANGSPAISTSTFATDTTLYAYWKQKRTLTLDNQGATTAGTTSVSVAEGESLLSITAPTKTGYAFGGYYTSTNGSGIIIYNPDGTPAISASTFTADTTLYAYWTARSYTITLDNQSAITAGTTSVTATYNSALSAITPPTRTGYDFGGYYTATNGGGTKIYNANGTPAISSSTFTANTTLYASWIAYKKITLATNISGAAGVLTGGGSYAQGSQVTLTAYANKGYNFCYWLKDDAEFSGNDTNVIIITADSDATYTAVFEEAGINVNVFLVSATKGGVAYVVGQNSEELTDDDEIIVATDICAVGYEFVGWYLDNDRSNCLSTDMSFKVKKSVAYKHALIAVYREISNNSVNQDTDN